MTVDTKQRVPIIIEPLKSFASTHLFPSKNGVGSKQDFTFRLLIDSFGDTTVRLRKWLKITHAALYQLYTVQTDKLIADVLDIQFKEAHTNLYHIQIY